MGWGFGVIVNKNDADDTISVIEKSGVEAEHDWKSNRFWKNCCQIQEQKAATKMILATV